MFSSHRRKSGLSENSLKSWASSRIIASTAPSVALSDSNLPYAGGFGGSASGSEQSSARLEEVTRSFLFLAHAIRRRRLSHPQEGRTFVGGFRCRLERGGPAAVGLDGLIDLGHHADGLIQRDNDPLVAGWAGPDTNSQVCCRDPSADTMRSGWAAILTASTTPLGGGSPHNPESPGGPEVRHWRKLAALLLAAACSGDATAPDPATVEPEPPAPSANRAAVATADDRAALVALYEATDGPNWTRNGNWLTDAPLGEWNGVWVGDGGRVEGLYLPGNALTGPIPPELGGLDSLRTLWLSESALTGPIPPELGKLASLETLNLRSNELTGPIPPEIGGLDSLGTLWLSDNALTGPVPEWLGGLDRLGALDLRSNELTGPIPPELSNLASLKTLSLWGNALTGPIPPELGNLASLETLSLSDNALTGPIPPELGGLDRLWRLNLSDNDLSGPIPLELGNLASLKDLSLSQNKLTGPIPPELGGLDSLGTLDLWGNALTGPIPPELGNLARLGTLDLRSNELTGPIPPELGGLDRLWRLNLSDNDLSGPIPLELGGLDRLVILDLRSNELTGPIPPELGNLASLKDLSLSHNKLTGPIPPEIGDLASLEWLDLACVWTNGAFCSNGLTGPIPPELGKLASLETLYLNSNDLSGPIPPEIGNLASLGALSLYYNELTGPIPPELAGLARLRSFGLEGNAGLCVPDDDRLRTWMRERRFSAFPCSDPSARLLPRALMREDGNGLSLALPDSLRAPSAVSVSDSGVVAATVADGWLVLEPRSIGRADVELVPSGGGSPAVAGVVVREAVGTFGIDIVMEQPVPLSYEETLTAAADWWSSVLDGTEWPDRRTSSETFPGTNLTGPPPGVDALVDDLLIFGRVTPDRRGAWGARWSDRMYASAGMGSVWVGSESGRWFAAENILRHEIGHVLGLVLWPPETGLTTEDRAYFIGPRAVEAYRAGGGDPDLPGVPAYGGHWGVAVGSELMSNAGLMDGLSLAALADAGYTVDMTKATPWRKRGATAAAVAAEPFRDVVEVRIVPRPVPE